MYKLKVIVDENNKTKFEVLRENGIYYYIVQDKNNNITKMPTNWVKEHIDEIINAGLSGNNLYVKKAEVNKGKYSNFKCLGVFRLKISFMTKYVCLFEAGKDTVYLDITNDGKISNINKLYPELYLLIDNWFKYNFNKSILSVGESSLYSAVSSLKSIEYFKLNKGRLEIKCKINGKIITFESVNPYTAFEIANME